MTVVYERRCVVDNTKASSKRPRLSFPNLGGIREGSKVSISPTGFTSLAPLCIGGPGVRAGSSIGQSQFATPAAQVLLAIRSDVLDRTRRLITND